MINYKNASFMLRYGSPEMVDTIIHSDIPHWDDVHPSQRHSISKTVWNASKNQGLTDRQYTKLINWPDSSNHLNLLENQPNLASHHLEHIANLSGQRYSIAKEIMNHKNVTSAAMEHVLRKADFEQDRDTYRHRRDELKAAGK